MERAAVAFLFASMSQAQFFSPSFAFSPLPVQLGFPRSFPSQTLSLPAFTGPSLAQSSSKKANSGTYTAFPIPIPSDPAANPSITNLLTNYGDAPIVGSKAQQAQALFDQNSFRSFNIELPTQNVAIINSDPTKEYRVHCRLTTDYNTPQAQTFSDFAVGCGYKGSVGSLRVCLDENHRDNKICRKLSMRVDARAFDDNDDNNQKAPLFYGMRSLLFGGMPVDLSMMSERTAFYLLESLGIVAPHATHAKLFMNGKYLGLYSFVQPVDEEFVQIEFANDNRRGKGALYKELWFNPLHMQDIDLQSGDKSDDAFVRQVQAAVLATPNSGDAPRQFFEQYFDVQSLVDVTAFNTAIGATDDWRQRHNYYLYVRDDAFGKKLVWIPWDYDRLYDEGADTRGALKGRPWWDVAATGTSFACNQPAKSSQQQANELGGTPARIAWNKDIFDQFPLDINVPVTCDKFTQLMATALASRIRQRTREIAGQISVPQIRSQWSVWSAQIRTALERDPSGPAVPIMLANQQQLEAHLTRSLQKAVSEANQAEGIASSSLFSSSISSIPSFTPRSIAFPSTTSFTPASSFLAPSFAAPSFSSSFSTPAFSSFSSFPSSISSFSSPSFSTFPGSFVPRSVTPSFFGG